MRSSFHLRDSRVPFLGMPLPTPFILTVSPECRLSAEDLLRPRGRDKQMTALLSINSQSPGGETPPALRITLPVLPGIDRAVEAP